jgi:hypothetical protein
VRWHGGGGGIQLRQQGMQHNATPKSFTNSRIETLIVMVLRSRAFELVASAETERAAAIIIVRMRRHHHA